jgi:hypothetical protein
VLLQYLGGARTDASSPVIAIRNKAKRRKVMKFIYAILLLFLVSGCATPVRYTNAPLSTYDKDTEYAIEKREDGFSITVYYSRYQFIPESSAVATACKSQLTAIAWEHSDNEGKKNEPVNEQRIRISMGRNGISGITSCQANAIVKWEK